MAFKQDDVIQCANDLNTGIAEQQESGKTIYDYIKSIDGKIQIKGSIVLVVMLSAYSSYLFYYGSLRSSAIAQKMAFYAAVTAGVKMLQYVNKDTTFFGRVYTILSNLPEFIKNLKITIDEIKEIMSILNALEEDFINVNDASGSVALQGINDDFPSIAITLDVLGGAKNG